jgi:hypothetical protein
VERSQLSPPNYIPKVNPDQKGKCNALAKVALYKRSAPSHLVGNLATTSSLLSLFVRLFGLSLPGMHPQTDKKGQQKKLDYQPPN